MPFDTSVKDWRGNVIGYHCLECGDIVQQMWGEVCNRCRDVERRHKELIAAIDRAALRNALGTQEGESK